VAVEGNILFILMLFK